MLINFVLMATMVFFDAYHFFKSVTLYWQEHDFGRLVRTATQPRCSELKNPIILPQFWGVKGRSPHPATLAER